MTGKELAEALTPETLILRLRGTEHDFVERKSKADKEGWLKSAVAFANSAPMGYPAVLFVGAGDDGTPHAKPTELEDIMRSISSTLDNRSYPSIYRHYIPLHLPEGSCIAVVIPGSTSRPHFTGKAYIRDGHESKDASEDQFRRLVAERNSKAHELLRWVGKDVTLEFVNGSGAWESRSVLPNVTVFDCSAHYVTFEWPGMRSSYPLEIVYLSFDWPKARLKIEIWKA
jgi:hypothetical protein